MNTLFIPDSTQFGSMTRPLTEKAMAFESHTDNAAVICHDYDSKKQILDDGGSAEVLTPPSSEDIAIQTTIAPQKEIVPHVRTQELGKVQQAHKHEQKQPESTIETSPTSIVGQKRTRDGLEKVSSPHGATVEAAARRQAESVVGASPREVRSFM